MLDELPGYDGIIIYPVGNGGRWIATRAYAIFVPVGMLSLTEMHLPAGMYKYTKAPNKNGRNREMVKETLPDLNSIFPEMVGDPMTPYLHSEFTLKESEKKSAQIRVTLFTPDSTKFEREDKGPMVDDRLLELVSGIYPNAVPHGTGQRLYPLFYVDKSVRVGTPHSIVATIIGIKYW